MATFRDIDERILALITEEGEILDVEAFDALQMERQRKVESMALWALDLRDEQEALKNEIKRLQARLASAERKEQRLREYLQIVLGGEKLRTERVSISYRTTPSVEIQDDAAVREWAMAGHDEVLRYREPEISKTELKALIQSGETIPGAALVSRTSTIIK